MRPWHVYSVKLCRHVWHLKRHKVFAFLGPIGTYTHSAVLKHFGHDAIVRPLPTIDEVFREVEAGSAHYGLVPVETHLKVW